MTLQPSPAETRLIFLQPFYRHRFSCAISPKPFSHRSIENEIQGIGFQEGRSSLRANEGGLCWRIYSASRRLFTPVTDTVYLAMTAAHKRRFIFPRKTRYQAEGNAGDGRESRGGRRSQGGRKFTEPAALWMFCARVTPPRRLRPLFEQLFVFLPDCHRATWRWIAVEEILWRPH